MDFAFNEEQLELQEMIREFVEKEITPFASEMDRNNVAMPGLMEKAGEMGLLNVIVPEAYGGPGLDSVTIAMIYEELGKGCAGIATSMAANSLASYPILLRGTEEQKIAHCNLLNDGGLAAFALTEPG
ncbi:MAG: acyl-CoA dehydrogenase family protein, partial [Acidaminococcaceae bacterium]